MNSIGKLQLLFGLAVALLMVACSSEKVNVDPALVGKWRSANRPDLLLFLSENGGGFIGTQQSQKGVGWRVKDKQLEVNVPDINDKYTWQKTEYEVSADGKELTVGAHMFPEMGKVFKKEAGE
jgi:hypothetical protein